MLSLKNIEVELRALVPNIEEFKKVLEKKDIKVLRKVYLYDIYYCAKNINKLEEVEMNNVGSYSLRLRKIKEDEKKEKVYLNTKTITKKGDHNAWEEHETQVSDFNEIQEILKMIGFKDFFKLEKNRFYYKYKDLNIFLDNINDFGACIEVEKIVAKGNEDNAKLNIKKFLNSIGINKKDIVAKSVTNLVMKARAFK